MLYEAKFKSVMTLSNQITFLVNIATLLPLPFLLFVNTTPVDINGIGSAFPSRLMHTWSIMYGSRRQHYKDVIVSYQPSGSRIAETAISHTNSPILFAVSGKRKHDDIKDHHLILIPFLAGPIVICYNIPGVKLSLHLEHLAEIFSGEISHWNDSRLQFESDVPLANEKITTVVRRDETSQTEVLTAMLAEVDQIVWNVSFGVFSSFDFINKRDGRAWCEIDGHFCTIGPVGMLGVVKSIRYSIGYIDYASAVEHNLQIADLYNQEGKLIDKEHIAAAVQCSLENDVEKALLESRSILHSDNDCAKNYSYPFTLVISLIFNRTTSADISCETQTELIRFLDWFMTDSAARQLAEDQTFIQLSPEGSAIVKESALLKVTCNGNSVYEMVRRDQQMELNEANAWKRHLLTGSILIVVFVVLTVFCVMISKQVKLRQRSKEKRWILGVAAFVLRRKSTAHSSHIAIKGEEHIDLHFIQGIVNGKSVIGYRNIIPKSHFQLDRDADSISLRMEEFLEQIKHKHIQALVGVLKYEHTFYFAFNCIEEKGSLWFVIRRYDTLIDKNVRLIMAHNIAKGMAYLHSHHLLHGGLTTISCVVDVNWNISVTDWAQRVSLTKAREDYPAVLRAKYLQFFSPDSDKPLCMRLLLCGTDPKVLLEGTKFRYCHDVYSFGVLLIELFTSKDLLKEESDTHVFHRLKSLCDSEELPKLPSSLSPIETGIVEMCLKQDINKRAKFNDIDTHLSHMARKGPSTVVESLLYSMENYALQLEDKVEERTSDLQNITAEMENLLENMLPKEVAVKLRAGEAIQPEYFKDVSICFCDIVGFTTISSHLTAYQVIDLLNHIYTNFDEILGKFDVYKVETIGDGYMVSSGVPRRIGNKHAQAVAGMSIAIHDWVSHQIVSHTNEQLQIRIGLHSGSCTAGIVGIQMPRYCLFGDTVNTASRMESTSLPMKIQVSKEFKEATKPFPEFKFAERGLVEVKGKGAMNTFWLQTHTDDKVYVENVAEDFNITIIASEILEC